MKIGVLGLGFMGSTHLQGIARIPELELFAVMDSDERRLSGDLSGIQGNLGGPGQKMDFSAARQYRSPQEIVADPDVEALDICLPTHLHAPIAISALEAGKHVIVEKPMALDGPEAARMIDAARRSGKLLMVAQVLRFFPAYECLGELVKSGRLGPIRSAFFRRRTAVPTWGAWEFDKSKSGGGIFDLLIHDVDQVLDLFGWPEAVSATGYEKMQDGVDVMMGEFHFPHIGSVTVTGGWFHRGEYPFSMEYTVIGDKGVVEFSSSGRPATVYWADGRKEALPAEDKDAYQAELAYFAQCCIQGAPPKRCTPESSALAVRLTKQMVDARERRGERLPAGLA